MEIVCNKLMPIFVLVIFGMVLRRVKFFGEETFMTLQKFVLTFCIPCMLFTSFIKFELDRSCIAIAGSTFFFMCALLGLGYLFMRFFSIPYSFFPFFVASFGTGTVGMPLFSTVFGAENVGYIAVFSIGHEFYMALILLPLVQLVMAGKKVTLRSLGKSLCSGQMIMVFLSVLINLTGLTDPIRSNVIGNSIFSAIEMIGNLTMALTVILLGYRIRFDRMEVVKPALRYALLRMVLSLAFGFVWLRFITVPLAQGGTIIHDPLAIHGFYTMIMQHSVLMLTIFVGHHRPIQEQEIVNNATVITMLLSLFLYSGYMILFV